MTFHSTAFWSCFFPRRYPHEPSWKWQMLLVACCSVKLMTHRTGPIAINCPRWLFCTAWFPHLSKVFNGKVQPSFLAQPEWMELQRSCQRRFARHGMAKLLEVQKAPQEKAEGSVTTVVQHPGICYTCTIIFDSIWIVSENSGTPKIDGIIMENPIRMDDLGVPKFLETPHVPLRWIALGRPFETAMEKWRSSSLWWLPRVRRYSTDYFLVRLLTSS